MAASSTFTYTRNLAYLRCISRLTQWQLACAAQVWPSTISQLERQKRGARRRTVQVIADALGVTPAQLTIRPTSREERAQLDAAVIGARDRDRSSQ